MDEFKEVGKEKKGAEFTYDSDLEVRSEAPKDGSLGQRLLALRRFGRHLGKTKKKKNKWEITLFCLSACKNPQREEKKGQGKGKSCDIL